MNQKLGELVSFDIERLFNGAVNVDWLIQDRKKAEQVASAFVFHGQSYHGVSEQDIGATGHRLIDSASFVLQTVESLNSTKTCPFVLAIAGFGSGKSHLAVTLSELLSTTNDSLRSRIIEHVAEADKRIAETLCHEVSGMVGNMLVLTLNGMNDRDLSSELLRQLKDKIAAQGLSTAPLENLRKRFKHAASILQNLDSSLLGPLLVSATAATKAEVINRLGEFDEPTYKVTHDFLQSIGIPLSVIGDETAKDVLNLVATTYVGEDKPFKKLLILFDEFGHYMEFATSNPQLSGSGALQHLFEGVQNNDNKIAFIGFVQYELKAYEQRLPSAFKNEVRRFITRFDSASKLYLSSNLETLVASLMCKNSLPDLDPDNLAEIQSRIRTWYPVSENYSVWSEVEMFNRVIANGCWPLSPLTMWVLFHLSSSGQYLQQRSALTLLHAALTVHSEFVFSDACPSLPPVKLWTTELQQEFESMEEGRGICSAMQPYNAVVEKHGQHLSKGETDLLRSVVLLTQTRLRAASKDDAWDALASFSGIPADQLQDVIASLEEEKNLIAWDDAFKQYEILGDSVSRPQFLRILRQKANEEYDDERKSQLFIKRANQVPNFPSKVECDFALDKSITTQEWSYSPIFTYWKTFKLTAANLMLQLREKTEYMPIDSARGLVIYCYVPQSESPDTVKDEAQRILKTQAAKLPVILVLLLDGASCSISKPLVDLDILESMSDQEKIQYNRLIPSHEKKQQNLLDAALEEALLARNFFTPYPTVIPIDRLTSMGSALFAKVFGSVLPFPFDGYATARGNAARDCMEFTRRLLTGTLSFGDTQTMPPQQRNRAQTVLQSSWNGFARDGSLALRQPAPPVRAIVLEWDQQLACPDGMNCATALKLACAAPYGANLASAGLLFGVYVQARLNMISITRSGVPISLVSVSDRLFTGQLLDVSFLGSLHLLRAESGNSEWDQMISDWENCATYKELAEFIEKKNNLIARLPIPPALRNRIEISTRQSEEAQRKIEKADQFESDAISKTQNGIERRDIRVMSWGASLMQTCIKHKSGDPMWSEEEDVRPLVEMVNAAKQHIIRDFPGWLPTNRPHDYTADSLSKFKFALIEQIGGNLKNLGLTEQRDALVKYVEGISRSFELISEAQQKISNADGWLAGNVAISRDATIVQLDSLRTAIESQTELLKSSRTSMKRLQMDQYVDDLTARIDRMNELLDKVAGSHEVIKKRATSIWNAALDTDTSSSLLDEVSDLMRLYAGSSTNVDDFRIMRNLLTEYIDITHRLDNLQISEDQLAVLVTESREAFVSKFTEEEPPWDPKEVFDTTIAQINDKRSNASREWVARMQEKFRSVEALTLQEADEGLRLVLSPPPFFNARRDSKKIEIIIKKLEEHLEAKGVEWLFEKFSQLSVEGKKAFLALTNQ